MSDNPGALLVFLGILLVSVPALTLAPAWRERGSFRPATLVADRAWWTLVTSAFLHADWPHLAMNLFTFWAFAFALEESVGTGSFLLLYLFGLMGSNAATYWRHREQPGYQCLGASGAISAVLFAFIVYHPTAGIVMPPFPQAIPAPWFALGYLGLSAYAARQGGGRIAHDAHLAGALAGLLYVGISQPSAYAQAWRLWLA